MAESTQHKLDRVRPPRVQITYDVETGDAIEMKELPFVAGIMADLSGKPEEPLPRIKDRKFVEIDRDNFNDVLAGINPRLVFQVKNRLADDDTKLNVELKFKNVEDFDPVSVLKQVSALKKLYDARQRLSDLLTKLDGNDDLDKLLQDIVHNTEELAAIRKQARKDDDAGAEEKAEAQSDSGADAGEAAGEAPEEGPEEIPESEE
ncbi:type VI secretion system contractile sheath smal l subunit [Desulfonema ishimotonii]|uniref:Type VI secretion system contractile sheath smal l subunit n=1 Tax=Desulfonema ishimotonii TaxID=45657 RepID=A0A401FYV6_9BACT|nr:type VI secretion system contractile sheath small subunit [Desulfonema ishimotonii]GBC62145.1 type VI secretion system contractile sheath smal l subunit [Desulfonema ishimotonii]